jgi:hypothetical protein
MQPPLSLALYEERLDRLWQRLVTTLGIHTARVLLERALWQTAQRHPALALLHHDEGGLCFAALERSYAYAPRPPQEGEGEGEALRPQEELEAVFTDLCAELRLILTRLLGGELAQRTCAGLPEAQQAGAGWA